MGVTVALLAGCAVAVPLRPLATSSQNSGDGHLSCSADRKCSNGSTDHRLPIAQRPCGTPRLFLRTTRQISSPTVAITALRTNTDRDVPVSAAASTNTTICWRMRPSALHDEITADYNDMIYAATREEFEPWRKSFLRKWRLKHAAVVESLREAGDRLFTFTRLPPSQWRSARTTNAIERCTRSSSEGSRRRLCCLPQRPRPCCSGHCSLPAQHAKGRRLANTRYQAYRSAN